VSEPIIQQLKLFLIKELFVDIPVEQISPNDGLQTVLGLDSICFIELRMLCEEHYGITISDAEFSPEHFRTLSALTQLIESKVVGQELDHG
jgi:acyl carrier protein